MGAGKCLDCGGEITAELPPVGGVQAIVLRVCWGCQHKRNAEYERRHASEARQAVLLNWEKICPASYRETDANHPNFNKAVLREVLRWSGTEMRRGIVLHGPTGVGKTRMAYLALKNLHLQGRSVKAVRSTRFGQYVSNQWSDDTSLKREARDELQSMKLVRYLLFDDLGKERFTPRLETEFYDLIEERTGEGRPTIFTSQLFGNQLAACLSKENGEAIVRRIREFCDCVECEPASRPSVRKQYA